MNTHATTYTHTIGESDTGK